MDLVKWGIEQVLHLQYTVGDRLATLRGGFGKLLFWPSFLAYPSVI